MSYDPTSIADRLQVFFDGETDSGKIARLEGEIADLRAALAGQQAGARTETEINEVLEACSELIDNQNDPWGGLKTYAEGVLNGIDWALGHVDTHPIYEPATKESAS